MSNETDYMITLQYNFISQEITKYAGIILYFLCLFGTVINILTFMNQTYNSRSCSLYLLIASYFDLIHLFMSPLSNMLLYGFQCNWTVSYSVIFCKIQSYVDFVSSVTPGTLTTITSIDRYILSRREYSQWKYCTRSSATNITKLIILFWLIASIPISLCYDRLKHASHNEQLICSNSFHIPICLVTHVLYVCIFNGFFHPIVTLIFGILTSVNIHKLRQRSNQRNGGTRQVNEQLTAMIALQSIKSSFASFPISLFNCYLLTVRHKQKSFLYEAKENLVHQIFYLLFWSNYTSFAIYMYSSDIFRKQWFKVMRSLFYYPCRGKEKRLSYCPEANPLRVP